MSKPLKFKRAYAGRYVAQAKTIVAQPSGREEVVDVDVVVRHMPQWSGEKWAVEVEGRGLDYTMDLVKLTDIIAHTKAEAVEQVNVAVAGGWKYVPGLGYCAR